MTDAGVEPAVGSVTNREDVAAAVRNASAIFHLAGKVSRDNEDAAAMNRVHVEGTRILCKAAKEAGVQTMLLASSSGTIAVSEDERDRRRDVSAAGRCLFAMGVLRVEVLSGACRDREFRR